MTSIEQYNNFINGTSCSKNKSSDIIIVNNENLNIPKKTSEYLLVENFLSEYNTDLEKQFVMQNILLLDKVPTEDSTNLISSGVIYKIIRENKETVDTIIELINRLERNKLDKTDQISIDQEFNDDSTNPVQNKIIKQYLDILSEKIEELRESIRNSLTENNLNRLFKTINGESIIGQGNITIKQESTENYITQEDLINYMNPLKIIASINPSFTEYTGEDIPTTITFVTKKGNTIINPDNITLTTVSNNTIEELHSTSVIKNINHKGSTTFTINCQFKNESNSVSITTIQSDPTYIGFLNTDNVQEVVLSELNKKILPNISMTETLNNTIKGSYLWIISPYAINKIATDPGFTFNVSMDLVTTINDLNYYRSSSQIDISNLTYYIK